MASNALLIGRNSSRKRIAPARLDVRGALGHYSHATQRYALTSEHRYYRIEGTNDA
jgi:hypothetical protein